MISTELNRIIAVKPVLKEIIEHNGGSVPEGALISQYADSIMAIKKQTGYVIGNIYHLLTFECVGLMSNQTQAWIALEKIGSPTIGYLYYFINGVQYDYTLDTKIYLRIGDRVSFVANVSDRSSGAYIHFYGGDGYFNAYGDVTSMNDFSTSISKSGYAYANLFALVNNKVLPLLKAPDFSKIKTHSQYMFYRTFYNNTYLLDGPELDFMNYTTSNKTPISCCQEMCCGCVNLRYIKVMCGASGTIGTNCFSNTLTNTNGSGRFYYNSAGPTTPSGWVTQRGTLFD